MKIMKKLLLWEHEDTSMRTRTLNDAQFGFRKMRSTESAHSVVAGHVEYALIQRRYTVMAALDIEGAYDNLQNSDMSNSLREFGASEEYIHWYEDFFGFRKNFIAHRGISLVNYPSQGAPQGGVGSPHLWSQVMNGLLDQLDSIPGIVKVAYADDLAVLASGNSVIRCVEAVQRAINLCCSWGVTKKLRFSPSKTESILFWKARNLDRSTCPQLQIENKLIEYKSKIKYLGLHYNEKMDSVFE